MIFLSYPLDYESVELLKTTPYMINSKFVERYFDNLDKSLHQLDTHEKVDSGLQHYYSPTEKRSKDFGHMIISKTKLD